MDGFERKCLLGAALAAGVVLVVLGVVVPVTVASSHLHAITSYVAQPGQDPPPWSTETTMEESTKDGTQSYYVYDGTVNVTCSGVLRPDQSDEVTRTPAYSPWEFPATSPCVAARHKRRTVMIATVGAIVIVTLAALVLRKRRRTTSNEAISSESPDLVGPEQPV